MRGQQLFGICACPEEGGSQPQFERASNWFKGWHCTGQGNASWATGVMALNWLFDNDGYKLVRQRADDDERAGAQARKNNSREGEIYAWKALAASILFLLVSKGYSARYESSSSVDIGGEELSGGSGASSGGAREVFESSVKRGTMLRSGGGAVIKTPELTPGQDPAACVLTSNPVLGGYDVVSYHQLKPDADAVAGSSAFQATFKGYTFYFSSETNRKNFEMEPEKYLPQFGGFCAYGISTESMWDWTLVQGVGPEANPSSWIVHDGKLYIFMYDVPKRKFLQSNVQSTIKEGERRWENITSGSLFSYFNTGCFWDDIACGRSGEACIGEAAVDGPTSIREAFCITARNVDYDYLPNHTLAMYRGKGSKMAVMEPHVTNVLKMARCDGSFTDDYTVRWTAEMAAGSPFEEIASFKFVAGVLGHSEVTATAYPPNAEFWLSATATDSNTGETHVARQLVHVKHVRRELRQLTKVDREAYFDALQTVFLTTQEDGEALYGKDFTSHGKLAELHNSEDNIYHGNLFFLTSHPAMQLRLEASLRSVNPAVATPYWDFLRDADLHSSWWKAPVYSIGWFGPVMTTKKTQHRPLGRFFSQKRIYDPTGKNFPKAWHNTYGFVSAPQSTANGQYLLRSGTVCNYQLKEGFANCEHVKRCFQTFSNNNRSLARFDRCLETYVHANLHDMHAGMWDCSVDWQEFADNEKAWLPEKLMSVIGVMMPAMTKMWNNLGCEFWHIAVFSLASILKFPASNFLVLLRLSLSGVKCPEVYSCQAAEDSADTCSCASNIVGIQKLADVDTWDATEMSYYMNHFWDAVCTSSFAGGLVAEFDMQSGHCRPKNVDVTSLVKLNRLIAKTLLWPGVYGDMASGAASTDPLFWVMHQMFDKAMHALRLSPRYNEGAFTWDQDDDTMGRGWTSETPFKVHDFEVYLDAHHHIGDSDERLTNEMLWSLLDPNGRTIPYVYDNLLHWGNCKFDPMESQ